MKSVKKVILMQKNSKEQMDQWQYVLRRNIIDAFTVYGKCLKNKAFIRKS